MYLAGGRALMECMGDDKRMPGQSLPTWAITLLVVVFSVAGFAFLLAALVS